MFVGYLQEMQEDQQKQLKDMKENIGYYQKKAREVEVKHNNNLQLVSSITQLFNFCTNATIYPFTISAFNRPYHGFGSLEITDTVTLGLCMFHSYLFRKFDFNHVLIFFASWSQ